MQLKNTMMIVEVLQLFYKQNHYVVYTSDQLDKYFVLNTQDE